MPIIERERKKCLEETVNMPQSCSVSSSRLQGVGHEFQSLLATCNRDAVPASRRYLGLRFTKWLHKVLALTIETAMRRSLHKGWVGHIWYIVGDQHSRDTEG
ncbi:hypothetical protein EAF00_004761 [Botryotinia globosa]|nr:hypothetical protein EAF00_004761 [Botryotinia globosa]